MLQRLDGKRQAKPKSDVIIKIKNREKSRRETGFEFGAGMCIERGWDRTEIRGIVKENEIQRENEGCRESCLKLYVNQSINRLSNYSFYF